MRRLKPQKFHEVTLERLSVTQKIYQLLDRFKGMSSLTFDEVFENESTKSECVITFLALLEMIRLKLIRVWQAEEQGAIRIEMRDQNEVLDSATLNSEFDEKTEENHESPNA